MSANIAAIPAPSSALVELALWPRRAAANIIPLSEDRSKRCCSLAFSGFCVRLRLGHQSPIPPADHQWQSEFLSEPSLKTFGSSGAVSVANGGNSQSRRAKSLLCLCMICLALSFLSASGSRWINCLVLGVGLVLRRSHHRDVASHEVASSCQKGPVPSMDIAGGNPSKHLGWKVGE